MTAADTGRSLDKMAPEPIIEMFLRACRRRLLLHEALAGAMAVGAAVVGVLFLAGLARELGLSPPPLRSFLFVVLAVVVSAAVYRYLLKPWSRFGKQASLARELEERLFPEVNLDWVSAVRLRECMDPAGERLLSSTGLIKAHLERVAGQMARTEPSRVVDWRRLKKTLSLLAVAALAWALLCIIRPAAGLGAAEFLFGSGTDTKQQATGIQPSWIGDIDLLYRYPAYTGRKDRRIGGTDGSILALPGTRVSIESLADRQVSLARLQLDDNAVPLEVVGGKQLSGTLTVMKAGRYRFSLQDRAGNAFEEPQGHSIRLEVDNPPRVDLKRPEKDLQIRDLDALEILYDAKDDFGLSQVRLVWRVAGRARGEQSRLLHRLQTGKQRVSRRSFRWELEPLGLEPGDRLQFYVEALDNDTVNGPKTGRSVTCNVKVFSASEHHRELMQKARVIWEKLLSGLADTLELEPEAGQIRSREPAAYENVYERAERLLGELETFLPRLRKDPLAHEPLVDAMVHIAARLRSLQSRLAMFLRPALLGPDQSQHTSQLLAAHSRRRIYRMEKDVLYLEDILDVVRLKEMERLARELEESRERLASLMEKYAAAPDETVRRQIEAEIAHLKEKIASLLQRQRELLKGIRDEYFNPDALAKLMSDRDILGALDEVQRLLAEGKVQQAMDKMAQLQKQIAGMQAAIERSLGNYGSEKYAELAQQLARVMGELNMITETQLKLKDTTGEIRDRLLKNLEKQDRESLQNLFKRLRKRLAKVGERIKSIPKQWPDAYADRNRLRAKQHVRLLDMSLKAVDLAGSLDAAKILIGSIARLVAEIEFAERYAAQLSSAKRKEIKRHLDSARRAADGSQAIYEALKRVMPDPDRLLGWKDRQRLQQLARRQAELKTRLRALRRQMQQINESAPIFGQGAIGRMARGGHHMDKAASSLDGKRPGRAHPHQQNALAELQALRDALKKSCQGGKCGGIPMPLGSGRGAGTGGMDWGGPGGNPANRDIEIPDPEDYQPPEAFRRALLEGMKDPVPEDFEQQVRRYYEELVR